MMKLYVVGWGMGACVNGPADGPAAQVEVWIAAPAEQVWALVSDITTPARFSTELLEVRWLDEGPRAGARFVGRSRHRAMGEWETTSFVTRFEPPRCFAWAVTDPQVPAASWCFELTPESSGTRLRQSVRIGPGRSGLCVAIEAMPEKKDRIIARRLEEHRKNMALTLEGIKLMAQAGL